MLKPLSAFRPDLFKENCLFKYYNISIQLVACLAAYLVQFILNPVIFNLLLYYNIFIYFVITCQLV